MTSDKISRTLSDYASNLKVIRENKHLSDDGRRAQIKALHDKTTREVAALRGADKAGNDARKQELRRKLFGHAGASWELPSASEATSMRDARDRVSRVRKAEALGDLMQEAYEAGDTTLLRAAAARAWDQSQMPAASRHWAALVDEYVKDNPGSAAAMDELNTLSGPADLLGDALSTSVPTPAELSRTPPTAAGAAGGLGDTSAGHFFRKAPEDFGA